MVVTDITTGELMQQLRGHEGPVLALMFDTENTQCGRGQHAEAVALGPGSDRGKSATSFMCMTPATA